MLDIHDYKGRFERALRIVREDPEILEENRKEILRFSGQVKVEELDKTNTELGTMCKKPYAISIIGYLKEK